MAEIVFTATVRQDRERVIRINPKDSLGKTAKVDGGFLEGAFDGDSGNAEFAIEGPDNLDLVLKSDLDATEFPAVSVLRGKLDSNLSTERNDIDVTITIITVAAEAVTAGFEDLGDRPREAIES